MADKSFGFLSVVLFLFNFHKGIFGIENYCSKNTYNDTQPYMRFTKEATYQEFAVVGKFKGLHCCAKGYRSIEWYKDGKLYPWALPVSRMILYPPSANQTIYVPNVSEEDAGNYTCVLKNDTVFHSHTIYLKVYDKVPDEAKITYMSKDTSIAVGQKLRLFCEAFAGQVDLPDAYSEAVWRKVAPNETVYDVPPHAEQLKSTREDGQTFGTYLIITEVEDEDFGEYVCIITTPGNTLRHQVTVREKVEEEEYVHRNPVPVGRMLIIISVILFIIIAIIALYLQYGLRVQVRLKDSFTRIEENDGKSNDVLIVYSPHDSDIALGVLMETLEKHYRYKCTCRELLPTINMWYSDLREEAQKCRRIIAVLSPSTVNGNWDSNNIQQALNQLQSLGTRLVCVSLKSLPKSLNEIKNAQGETLAFLTHSIGIILWERKNDDKFWYSLRLRLPAKRKSDYEEGTQLTQVETSLRLNSDSQESLDILM